MPQDSRAQPGPRACSHRECTPLLAWSFYPFTATSLWPLLHPKNIQAKRLVGYQLGPILHLALMAARNRPSPLTSLVSLPWGTQTQVTPASASSQAHRSARLSQESPAKPSSRVTHPAPWHLVPVPPRQPWPGAPSQQGRVSVLRTRTSPCQGRGRGGLGRRRPTAPRSPRGGEGRHSRHPPPHQAGTCCDPGQHGLLRAEHGPGGQQDRGLMWSEGFQKGRSGNDKAQKGLHPREEMPASAQSGRCKSGRAEQRWKWCKTGGSGLLHISLMLLDGESRAFNPGREASPRPCGDRNLLSPPWPLLDLGTSVSSLFYAALGEPLLVPCSLHPRSAPRLRILCAQAPARTWPR